jgi:hypothetical protein
MKLILLLAASVMLAGCATQNAVFVTKTSLSVVDVDTSPVSATIAYDRTEGYIGPRLEDGKVYPVAGYLHTDGGTMARNTQQVFAGGRAAVLVSGGTPDAQVTTTTCGDNRANPPLIFATGTTMGIKVGFADGTPLPNSFTLGYRRKEASVVPVSKDCQPSVLATYDSGLAAKAQPTDAKIKATVAQYFATGAAAEALASDPVVKDLFKTSAKAALDAPGAFTAREGVQTRLALDVITCAGKVPDTNFDRVVNNAEDLDLVAGQAGVIRAGATIADKRRLYGEMLSLMLGAKDETTAALQFHKQRVCSLSAK